MTDAKIMAVDFFFATLTLLKLISENTNKNICLDSIKRFIWRNNR